VASPTNLPSTSTILVLYASTTSQTTHTSARFSVTCLSVKASNMTTSLTGPSTSTKRTPRPLLKPSRRSPRRITRIPTRLRVVSLRLPQPAPTVLPVNLGKSSFIFSPLLPFCYDNFGTVPPFLGDTAVQMHNVCFRHVYLVRGRFVVHLAFHLQLQFHHHWELSANDSCAFQGQRPWQRSW
jgi:hypothetical protein